MPAIVRPAEDLAVLAAEINAAHEAGEDATRKGLEHFRCAGEKLIRAKEQCGHGHWLSWLEKNVKFSVRQAQRYMALAKCEPGSHLEEQWRALYGREVDEEGEDVKSEPESDLSEGQEEEGEDAGQEQGQDGQGREASEDQDDDRDEGGDQDDDTDDEQDEKPAGHKGRKTQLHLAGEGAAGAATTAAPPLHIFNDGAVELAATSSTTGLSLRPGHILYTRPSCPDDKLGEEGGPDLGMLSAADILMWVWQTYLVWERLYSEYLALARKTKCAKDAGDEKQERLLKKQDRDLVRCMKLVYQDRELALDYLRDRAGEVIESECHQRLAATTTAT
jgi:hypothetical protein